MYPTAPSIGVQRCALIDDGWRGAVDQRGCYGEVRVPLSESVVDVLGGVWWSGIEWVVVGVDVVVGSEGREV